MTSQSKVVTRFAPSPTGFLHIGGARTALFNWLFARAHGGEMRLRIEDTDRARSTTEAIDAILDGLSWLGLDGDGEVVYQSTRAERHAEVAKTLLDKGMAYRCYTSAEELVAMREKAAAEGRPPKYDGTWRDKDPAEAPPGVDPVIRLKAPSTGETVIPDLVQGEVTFANENLDDLVILRSDGSPTYMLAVVVDDHDMGVTHIIRGDDHLTNAARQALIYEAMEWDVPQMAHIPLIHGPDGAKLSKRHGALGVDAYRAMGYLPEALRNYLVRLGWAHGDEEFFSTREMVEKFGLEAVGRSPARFDFVKLENMNGHYMREATPDRIMAALEPVIAAQDDAAAIGAALDAGARAKLEKLAPSLAERAKTLVELLDNARFIWAARPLTMDEKAEKLLAGEARGHLAALYERLRFVDPWVADGIEAEVRRYADEAGVKLGKVAQPLRAALVGAATSPGIFDVLVALGRAESLGRIQDQAAAAGD
ncbi:glutamate--tRNA ligase [Acuticoccus sp. I52.16.1]|uniref:glutamate--tRNA ligase n=1 Tax=Acuticoccus sp. I52.16.1 TaxID=2928472 RepID=UPI001FD2BC2B|nr:glutamate--tRNA ligase [Acuticoccus sp. I52.16.1]UOM34803.1 glutamate--tRNA ligase [Acuticoccus sp. I52.16.1]